MSKGDGKMGVEAISVEEFEERVIKAPRPVVVDVWAPWCGPCRAMAPHFEAAADSLGHSVQFFKLNADESQELVRQYKILGIPTVLYFSHGRLVDRKAGMQKAEAIAKRAEQLIEMDEKAAANREIKGWFRWPFRR